MAAPVRVAARPDPETRFESAQAATGAAATAAPSGSTTPGHFRDEGRSTPTSVTSPTRSSTAAATTDTRTTSPTGKRSRRSSTACSSAPRRSPRRTAARRGLGPRAASRGCRRARLGRRRRRPQPGAARTAAEIGADVRIGTIEDAGFEDDAFDLVAMMDVLEHTDEPEQHARRGLARAAAGRSGHRAHPRRRIDNHPPDGVAMAGGEAHGPLRAVLRARARARCCAATASSRSTGTGSASAPRSRPWSRTRAPPHHASDASCNR